MQKLFNFRIAPDLESAIKARAAEDGVSASDVARAALVQHLKLKTPVTVR